MNPPLPLQGQHVHIPAIQRLLAIPELLCLLTEELEERPNNSWDRPRSGPSGEPVPTNRQTLSRLARTCRSFCSPALDVLWRYQVGMRPLACTIPPFRDAYISWRGRQAVDRKKEVPILVPTRPIQRSDLTRFLSIYAPRVRYLTHGTGEGDIEAILDRDAATALFGDNYPHSPFINLSELQCAQPTSWRSRGPTIPLPDHRLFLGATIHTLTLNRSPVDERIERILADVPRLCPSLRVLHVHLEGPLFGSTEPIAPLCRVGFFSSLTGLCDIRVRHPLPAPALEALRELPHLQSLFMVPALDDSWDTPSAPSAPFRALNILFIDGKNDDRAVPCSAEECAAVLSVAYFPVLENLTIQADTIGSFQRILTIVEAHCSHTALGEIQITREQAVAEADRNLDDVIGEDIRPLYAFRNLHTVELREAYNFQLTDDEMLEMALAWPRLRHLSLNPIFQMLEENDYLTVDGGVPPPVTTLRALVHFARHCPELTDLGLRVCTADANVGDIRRMFFSEGPLRRIPPLTRLALAHNLPAGDPRVVLACIACLFPRLQSLDVRFSEEVEEGSEAWAELDRLFGGFLRSTNGPTYYHTLVRTLWGQR